MGSNHTADTGNSTLERGQHIPRTGEHVADGHVDRLVKQTTVKAHEEEATIGGERVRGVEEARRRAGDDRGEETTTGTE